MPRQQEGRRPPGAQPDHVTTPPRRSLAIGDIMPGSKRRLAATSNISASTARWSAASSASFST